MFGVSLTHHDAQKDRAAVRAEIEVLRRERLAYEQESVQTRQDLARSEAHCRALEARVTVLETEARSATSPGGLELRIDTLEDTGSIPDFGYDCMLLSDLISLWVTPQLAGGIDLLLLISYPV
ncbi:hypothetical protein Tco_1004374 [Tanacetum coccineum]|uniref:Uncharacterized protein n=1 Tax=Tanacetum coccineum TaxID=301880 RepID=A0ABQ5FBQ9_9ASTR